MSRWTRDRRFRPGLVPSLAVGALLPLLLGLGFWQLDRAGQKRSIERDFSAGGQVEVVSAPDQMETLGRYRRISLRGRFDGSRQFLLDNMTDGGAAGYQVLTPFLPDSWDRWVIVNRGWIRKDFTDATLPDIAVPVEAREIQGRLARLPRPGIALKPEKLTDRNWPRVVQFPAMGELEQALERPLAARSVLLDAGAPDGYLRRWQPAGLGPERHIGYAVQWFALAATLMIIYLVVNVKRIEHAGNED